MVNKITNIKERVVLVAEKQEVTKEYFFSKIGVTSANFRGKAQKTPLNSNVVENIITEFPEINLHWLITGEGEMLTKEKKTENDSQELEGSHKKPSIEDFLLDHIESLKRENSHLKDSNTYLQNKLDECHKLHSKEGKHAC